MLAFPLKSIHLRIDYEGAEEVFHLHNGDWPVTLVLDSRGRVFLALSSSSEPCSCLWNDQVIDGPLGMLMNVNFKIIRLGAQLLAQQACVSMSILDGWTRLCERLPSFEGDNPIQELAQMVRASFPM